MYDVGDVSMGKVAQMETVLMAREKVLSSELTWMASNSQLLICVIFSVLVDDKCSRALVQCNQW